MEIFLLLLDELDDAYALLRAWLPKALELLGALLLFGFTVVLMLSGPLPVLLAALTLLVAVLVQRQRTRIKLDTAAQTHTA